MRTLFIDGPCNAILDKHSALEQAMYHVRGLERLGMLHRFPEIVVKEAERRCGIKSPPVLQPSTPDIAAPPCMMVWQAPYTLMFDAGGAERSMQRWFQSDPIVSDMPNDDYRRKVTAALLAMNKVD